jgi:aryl-alcohol dehydrogenase-like predicted oxidoreductase
MKTRRIGSREVSELGFGCMNLNHAYGVPLDRETALGVLRAAVDLGITHFDTAALYGFGTNEELVGPALQPYRDRIMLASKCGMTGVDGKRVIDGRPETLKRTCHEALGRLRIDFIDLYYLHRWDKKVPIEDSVGALAELVRAGSIGAIGLCEISAATLRKAHAVHPIAAVQSEYSLWTRNPEVALLDACRECEVALVAFSPLGRGFLAGGLRDPATLEARDIRRGMPRFQSPHFERNLALLDGLEKLAREAECTKAQLALAWLLFKAPHVAPIFGTTSIEHLREDIGAHAVEVPPDVFVRLEKLINAATVSGARYPPQTQADIDTEELAPETGKYGTCMDPSRLARNPLGAGVS